VARSPQLDLFQSSVLDPPREPLSFAAEEALARRLPAHVRFGTSSWTFSGWAGLVYPAGTTDKELLTRGLSLYARCPLFRTVGIDRSYYAPLDRPTLTEYAAELPPGFRCVMKIWNEITSAVHPKTRDPNPNFLNLDLLRTDVLDPILECFEPQAGPLVFEMPPLRRNELFRPKELADKLHAFFARLPRQLSYAVELRNPEHLTREYLDVLREHGVAHVFSYWERMPHIGTQLDLPGVLTAPFAVARLLIPPGMQYDARKAELAPFDRILDPREEMRRDVARLSEACELLGKVLFVIVNNKAEGSSPLTIRALAERLARPS
jgi:uncharacterized protein YecE (DUF72 family)